MRSGNPIAKRGTAILDEPEPGYAYTSDRSNTPRRSARTNPKLRPDYGEDFADPYDDPSAEERPRQRGLKLKLRGRLPGSLWGRIATGIALLLIAGTGIALLLLTRSFLLHDARFMIQSPSAIEIQGNKHLTRNQLLDIFGEDIERNIFRISLVDRQTELEQLPWVEHAAVMRLLPGRIRVSLTERTPIAFVRQGGHIGLVDGNGVLLDMAPSGAPAQPSPHYSFPVVIGLSAADPASTRAARMKIFQHFTADLDSSKEKISEALSEVDLSDPEDVKALIPANSTEVLVHFGDDHFLERYRSFQSHLAAWHAQYPNLRSVDMRYEREVVLDMADSAPAKDAAAPASKATTAAPPVKALAPVKSEATTASPTVAHPPVKTPAKAPAKAPIKAKAKPSAKPAPHKPIAPAKKSQIHAAPPSAKPVPKPGTSTASAHALTTAPQADSKAAPSASAAARSGFPAKPAAGKPLLPTTPSPSQVTSR